jgi:AcrR family transcriptional regulator
LYRHFPSGEAFVDAAYRSELARLCASVPGMLVDGVRCGAHRHHG